jgi:Phage integrase family
VGAKVFDFRTPWGTPVCKITAGRRVVKLARQAGVRLTMKSLRQGFGCRYAGKVPAQVLQKLMRHANIRTTMEYYANIDEAAEEAVLGPRRNRTRNSDPAAAEKPAAEGRKSLPGWHFRLTGPSPYLFGYGFCQKLSPLQLKPGLVSMVQSPLTRT